MISRASGGCLYGEDLCVEDETETRVQVGRTVSWKRSVRLPVSSVSLPASSACQCGLLGSLRAYPPVFRFPSVVCLRSLLFAGVVFPGRFFGPPDSSAEYDQPDYSPCVRSQCLEQITTIASLVLLPDFGGGRKQEVAKSVLCRRSLETVLLRKRVRWRSTRAEPLLQSTVAVQRRSSVYVCVCVN